MRQVDVTIGAARDLILLMIFLLPLLYTTVLVFITKPVKRNRYSFILASTLKSTAWVVVCFIAAAVIVVLVIEDIEYLEDTVVMSAREIQTRVEATQFCRNMAVYI